MIISNFMFYIFAFLTVISAFTVVTVKNPVHSVLSLVFTFFNASGLFVLLGAEFVAMVLIIVYVGAVAVLFLFVVMMLNINFEEVRKSFKKNLLFSSIIALILGLDLILIIKSSSFNLVVRPDYPMSTNKITNAHALGNILYTEYAYHFQIAGVILLVAMIGSIVLTLRSRVGVRKQNITEQVMRSKKDTIELVKVKSGEGIDEFIH